jgi:D-sedoheptulose 7-phosphate isomerase
MTAAPPAERQAVDSDDLAAMIRSGANTLLALETLVPRIAEACRLLADTLARGGRVFTAGNGGSAAEAMHMAEELTGRFRADRRSLPGMALCADGTLLTCIGNDFGFDAVFARQVEGLGVAGDLLVLFSTSGKAANLRLAAEAAKLKGLSLLTLLGRDGGALAGLADVELLVPSQETERIQEAHLFLVHLLLDHVERCE